MNILGINFLSEASACLIQDGKVTAAVSEERLNRIKLWYGYPQKSIAWVLQNSGVKLKNIDVIATTGKSPKQPPKSAYLEKEKAILKSSLPPKIKTQQIASLWDRYEHESLVLGQRTPANISLLKKLGPKVVSVDHHLAHAASAYYTSGWNQTAILTIDGWGENSSHTLSLGKDGKITLLGFSNTFDSLGYYYGSVTKFLGFKPQRHEGKVLGLAAYGNPTHTAPIMRNLIGVDKKKKRFIGKMENGTYIPYFDNPNLAKVMTVADRTIPSRRMFTRADIAAGLQQVLEDTIIEYLKLVLPRRTTLCLAGGIFSNVKLNQWLLNLPNVENVYIYPNMGDGGLCVGAGLLVYAQNHRLKPYPIQDVYLGPEFSNQDIFSAIKQSNLASIKPKNIETEVAKLLATGHIVARFHGRMEWGPRALGNRSILYSPADPTVNDWLNKQLARTEFMPFAPVSTIENAPKCYRGWRPDHTASRFMTITYNCTPAMKRTQPAVVHKDGTARPQIIARDINPSYYKIVDTFYRLTGLPSLINTSFNMHEEPIVCTPQDAIRSFLTGRLEYLAIGPYLLRHPNFKRRPK